jgi:hypothetical protein
MEYRRSVGTSGASKVSILGVSIMSIYSPSA